MGRRETLTFHDKKKRKEAFHKLAEFQMSLQQMGLYTGRASISPARALEIIREDKVASLFDRRSIRAYTNAAKVLL